MKKILVYLVLLASFAVLAQLQLSSLQDPAVSGSGQSDEPAASVADEASGAEAATDGDADEAAPQDGLSGDQASPESQASAATAEAAADLDQEQLDSDFEPTEEISEDYPVPLPSDI